MYIQNPLDDFQSYSVHYVLLACRTTVAAKEFADDTQAVASLQAIENAKYLGSPVEFGNSSEDIFLILDTRRFGQFSVESLKYDVYINGLQKGASTSNLAADLSMVVLDSVGISFANFMQWLMDEQMKTNYDGLVFMLRTIFVGHNADGTSSTVQTETIPMHLTRMEINLDFAKGAYTLEFMPNMNFDVNRYGRFLTVSSATTYTSGADNLLGGLVNSFESELNRKSTQYFDSVQKTVQDAAKSRGTTAAALGRKVQYMITIPERWNTFKVIGANPNERLETLFQRTTPGTTPPAPKGGEIKNVAVGVARGTELTKALTTIFSQVPEVAELGNFASQKPGKAGGVTFYKYLVGITSDDTVMTVHVDVVEFRVPDIFTRDKKDANSVSTDDSAFYKTMPDGRRIPLDFVEYDYIFTGKNKDILNFEMKIQDFQFLLASNLRAGDNAMRGVSDSNGNTNATNTANGEDADSLIYARPFDPLVMPLDSESALMNFSKYTIAQSEKSKEIIAKSQQYSKNLSTFYAGSPITVVMTIKGNPLIMHKFNMGRILEHVPEVAGSKQSDGTSASKSAYRAKLEEDILKANPGQFSNNGGTFVMQNTGLSDKSYAVSPVFARVNIKGPNVDFRTNEPVDDGSPYASSVLSDNFYTIFKLSNTISSGMFTQEIELYSHNIFGSGNKISKA